MSETIEVPAHTLHPTQITVGMIEVRDKVRVLTDMHSHEQRKFLEEHPMPAVRAGDGKLYITDHHHLARALWEIGVEQAFVRLEEEFTTLTASHFWRTMVAKHWAHPINERGERRPYREIPRHVRQLRDDVYRSLAAFVREAGGFRKHPRRLPSSCGRTGFGRACVSGRPGRNFSVRWKRECGSRTALRRGHCPATSAPPCNTSETAAGKITPRAAAPTVLLQRPDRRSAAGQTSLKAGAVACGGAESALAPGGGWG